MLFPNPAYATFAQRLCFWYNMLDIRDGVI